jgi:hypothetical protein
MQESAVIELKKRLEISHLQMFKPLEELSKKLQTQVLNAVGQMVEDELETLSKLQCPCCESGLEPHEFGRYESIAEHVSDPNGEPSLKQTYRCASQICPTRQEEGLCWTINGETYGRVKGIEFIDGSDSPINSSSREFDLKGRTKRR